MKTENLSDVAYLLNRMKHYYVSGEGLSLSIDPETLKYFSRELYPLLEFSEFSGKNEAVSRLPGVFNRYDAQEIHVAFIGPTNGGKTGLARLLMSEKIADQVGNVTLPDGSVLTDILGSQNIPDKTKGIMKIRLSDSFIIWDTPGLYGDNPTLGKLASMLFGLENNNEVSELPVIEIDTSSAPASYEKMAVIQFPRERMIVIFMVDMTMTPFSSFAQQQLKSDIQKLKELYGERLLIVGSFQDKLDHWDDETREERINIWEQVLEGIPMIQYSGYTKHGLLDIVREIIRRSGQPASSLLPYFNTEAKGERFSHVLNNLSSLIATALTTFDDTVSAPRDMHKSLFCLVALYASIHYQVSENQWLKVNGDLAQIAAGVISDKKEISRPPSGFFENLAAFFFNKEYYTWEETRYLSVEALCETSVFLYQIVHGLEEVPSPVVEETVAEKWFATRYAADEIATALQTRDTYTLHLKIGAAILDFWREFHPSALDLSTRIGG